MTSEKEDLSAQESLDLINSMIRQAQGKIQDSSFYFLLWGWVTVAANFSMYGLLRFTDYEYPYIVWLIAVPAWIATMVHGSRHGHNGGVRTPIDRINMWTWLSYGIAILPIVLFVQKIHYQINPIVLVMTSVPTFLTGILLRFRPLIMGGISFYVFGIICFLVDFQTQYLIGGIAITCGYLVPGYLLRASRKKHV